MADQSLPNGAKEILGILRIKCLELSVLGFSSILIFAVVLIEVFPESRGQRFALRWGLQASLAQAYVVHLLRSGLPLNYEPGKCTGALSPWLGPGTIVTFFRGVLISMLAGFLFAPWPVMGTGSHWLKWVPGIIYLSAASGDFIDGYLARITHHTTRLGAELDKRTDALGLLIAPSMAIWLGQLPLFYIAVSFAYYFYEFGIWFRKRHEKRIFESEPRKGARLMAGFQMGFVGLALLPIFSPTAMSVAASIFMTPLIAGFLWDWLSVCGRIKAGRRERVEPDQRKKRPERSFGFMMGLFPLFLRLVILWEGVLMLNRNILPNPGIWNGFILAPLLLLVLGIMGRTAALMISFTAAQMISDHGLISALTVVYACALTLMLSGTGPLSLWKPEDRFLYAKAGERR